MCFCVCAFMCIFFFQRKHSDRADTYLRNNGVPSQEKLITPTKFQSYFTPALNAKHVYASTKPNTTGHRGRNIIHPVCAAVLSGDPHQLKAITASTINWKNIDFIL